MKIENRRFFIIASLIFGICFIVLSFFVNQDIFRNIDYESLVDVQKLLSYSVDWPSSIFTLLGSSEVTFIIIAAIVAFLFFRKKYFFSSIFLFILIYIIEFIGKMFIFHPKPPVIFNRYVFHFQLPSSFIVHTAFSYPSGHMARSAFLGVLFLFFIRRLKGRNFKKILLNLLVVFYIGGMFVSRIYLGEHWLSDVLGGFLLGSGVATLALSFW